MYPADSPFHRILATRYSPEREREGLEILEQHPAIARLTWPGPDEQGQPFIQGSSALHYAANDGKLRLMRRLIELGADVNADGAHWFRSVLSWAANNARLEALRLLLECGARADSLDALHAAAWGGSSAGQDDSKDYVAALELLADAGADLDDRRNGDGNSPLDTARASGNLRAIHWLEARLGETP